MPRFGLISSLFKSGQSLRVSLVGAPVPLEMIMPEDSFKILRRTIEAIAVFVMDVVLRRHRLAMLEQPDKGMKRNVRSPVIAQAPEWTLGITPELDSHPARVDGLAMLVFLRHKPVIPYFNVSVKQKLFSSVHIG